MNESFKRITEWAKAHPAASVGIVAALVVVGYLVYKNTSTSGSLTASGESGDTSGLTSGGGGESAVPDVPVVPSQPIYTYPTEPGALPPAINYALPDYGFAVTPVASPLLNGLKEGAPMIAAGKTKAEASIQYLQSSLAPYFNTGLNGLKQGAPVVGYVQKPATVGSAGEKSAPASVFVKATTPAAAVPKVTAPKPATPSPIIKVVPKQYVAI